MALDVKKEDQPGGRPVYGGTVQSSLNTAINQAKHLLLALEDSRLVSADADLSGVEEHPPQVRILIRAQMASGQDLYQLRKKLAERVSAPVYAETGVSIALTMLRPDEDPRMDMESEDGLLFPLLGR
ncbi:MAG TPA: hypothetical protein VGO93_05675 [Candidatus Xenobia bacterium]